MLLRGNLDDRSSGLFRTDGSGLSVYSVNDYSAIVFKVALNCFFTMSVTTKKNPFEHIVQTGLNDSKKT